MDGKYKIIAKRWSPQPVQHAGKEEQRMFQSTKDVYDMIRLKSFGCLVADLAIKERKS